MGRSVRMWPIRGREDDHVLFLAACGEEDTVLRVERKAGTSSTFAGDVVLSDHLHRVCVDDGDRGLVYDVDIDFAVAVGSGLLGAPPMSTVPRIEPSLSSEDSDVRRGMAEDVEAVIVGVVEVAVGIALNVDLFSEWQMSLRRTSSRASRSRIRVRLRCRRLRHARLRREYLRPGPECRG